MEVHKRLLIIFAHHTVEEFPPDILTAYQRQHGGILLHLLIGFYVCIGLGIVCDYYFVPSLEMICYRLGMQEDVGGATFMCIGSSAPGIVSSILAIMFVDGDLGVGTIMGTSIFDSLLVVGFCGLLTHERTKITWWPFVRDMIAYCLSIIILIIVTSDGEIILAEALIMVITYCLYVFLLSQNKIVEKKIYLLLKDKETYEARFEDSVMKKSLLMGEEKSEEPSLDLSKTCEDYDYYCGYPTEHPVSPFDLPESNALKIISWITVLPLKTVFFITIPDLRRPSCQKLFAATFLAGIFWIGALTYILLWMVTIIGKTLGIPNSIMGITFVTIGTSVPDLICSVVIMRRNKPDMAIAQAISATPLGILLGLGLPWLIKTSAWATKVVIDMEGVLLSSGIALLFTLVEFLIFFYRKFVLDKNIGYALIIGYVIYLLGAVVSQFFVDKAKSLS